MKAANHDRHRQAGKVAAGHRPGQHAAAGTAAAPRCACQGSTSTALPNDQHRSAATARRQGGATLPRAAGTPGRARRPRRRRSPAMAHGRSRGVAEQRRRHGEHVEEQRAGVVHVEARRPTRSTPTCPAGAVSPSEHRDVLRADGDEGAVADRHPVAGERPAPRRSRSGPAPRRARRPAPTRVARRARRSPGAALGVGLLGRRVRRPSSSAATCRRSPPASGAVTRRATDQSVQPGRHTGR